MAASFALIEPPVRQTKRPHAIRLLLVAGVVVATAWTAGLGWFIHLASRGVPAPPHATAIVVLTGGPERVEVALRLVAGGAADRLLVSGAGDKTDLAVLAHLAGIDPAPLEGQITLGHAAHSTHGNALETAAWAREQQVASLLVVTNWFHMPRALVELHRVMPAVTLYAYPVGRPGTEELSQNGGVRRMIGEYHKYLAALAGLTAPPLMHATRGSGPTR